MLNGSDVCLEVASEYDVVVDVLTKHRDKLDDIRLKQIAQINQCMTMWENRNDK